MRNCLKCQGLKTRNNWEGKSEPCIYCKGEGSFDKPDYQRIRVEITPRNKVGQLKTSLPSHSVSPRAYYVWRLARFHGGVDVTMPITAMVLIEGDPFIDELDEFADSVAVTAFGSNMRAAARYGKM